MQWHIEWFSMTLEASLSRQTPVSKYSIFEKKEMDSLKNCQIQEWQKCGFSIKTSEENMEVLTENYNRKTHYFA